METEGNWLSETTTSASGSDRPGRPVGGAEGAGVPSDSSSVVCISRH